MSRRRNPWNRVARNAWTLGAESAFVIGLRTLRLAAGGAAAQREARRMVEEKAKAALELQARALRGGLGLSGPGAAAKALAHYRRKVRANRRRLGKH